MKNPVPLPGKREVRNIWAWARSLATSQRYDGAADSDPHDTELLVLPSQQSLASVSKTTTKERTVQDQTLDTPMLGEATASTDEHRDIPANVLENNSPNKSRPSWIKGVYLCGYATAGLLLSNVIFVSVTGGLSSKFPGTGGSSNSKVIYDGSCDVTGRWNTGLHIIINIISTCTLATSNYCMQTLVAPTRDEINIAHAKRRWLDIGGSSFRNIFAISYARLGLWIVLLLTATPFHLLYNSLVFESLTYNHYWSFAAPYDFTPEDVRNLTTPALHDCFGIGAGDLAGTSLDSDKRFDWNQQILQIEGSKTERISAEKCYGKTSITNGLSGYRGIILLTSNRSMSDGGTESVLGIENWSHPGEVWAAPFVNSDPRNIQDHECTTYDAFLHLEYYKKDTMHVTECLAFEGKSNCQLFYNPIIAVIIIVATFVKVIAIFLAAQLHKSRSTPLLTSGDAIASFLEDPDETTKGMCWASLNSTKQRNWITCPKGQEPQRRAVRYQRLTRPQQWRRASSPIHWFVTVLIVLICIVTTTLIYPFFAVDSMNGVGTDELTWQAIWDLDSMARKNAITASGSKNYSELQGVVIANSAQLVVTLCYYFYNSLLTRMLLSAEYSSYGVNRKPLRVTWPVEGSKQRSTYWLSIPYRYGLPAMALFTILHWLVSQGIYFVLAFPYDADGNLLYAQKESAPKMSYMPLICAGALLGVLGIMIIGVSFRRLKSAIPLAGTCSAAISAACHPPENVRTDTVTHGELMWGETDLPWALDSGDDDESDGPKGHCSFTPSEARQPSLDKLYA
ncbi:uncharacterized protein N7446_005593 [Penicillium canescens]|uniref:uncharacterized protein n=1 Tax=Penicillium canescens TaxID=5083 RepID=UPI0026E0B317|nr:uncharacterized protein N7446_005593 [Penicillium canescens]KAJ6050166.1 hypothetical protein N7444_006882 [Penicillium canescens]KAJ6061473.1 hypothetical protein N7446_005593 [Penicillium canescens]